MSSDEENSSKNDGENSNRLKTLSVTLERLSPTLVENLRKSTVSEKFVKDCNKSQTSESDDESEDGSEEADSFGEEIPLARRLRKRNQKKIKIPRDDKNLRRKRKVNYKDKSDSSDSDDGNSRRERNNRTDSRRSTKRKFENAKEKSKSYKDDPNGKEDSDDESDQEATKTDRVHSKTTTIRHRKRPASVSGKKDSNEKNKKIMPKNKKRKQISGEDSCEETESEIDNSKDDSDYEKSSKKGSNKSKGFGPASSRSRKRSLSVTSEEVKRGKSKQNKRLTTNKSKKSEIKYKNKKKAKDSNSSDGDDSKISGKDSDSDFISRATAKKSSKPNIKTKGKSQKTTSTIKSNRRLEKQKQKVTVLNSKKKRNISVDTSDPDMASKKNENQGSGHRSRKVSPEILDRSLTDDEDIKRFCSNTYAQRDDTFDTEKTSKNCSSRSSSSSDESDNNSKKYADSRKKTDPSTSKRILKIHHDSHSSDSTDDETVTKKQLSKKSKEDNVKVVKIGKNKQSKKSNGVSDEEDKNSNEQNRTDSESEDTSKPQKRKGRSHKRSTSSESDTSNGGKKNSAPIFGTGQDSKPQVKIHANKEITSVENKTANPLSKKNKKDIVNITNSGRKKLTKEEISKIISESDSEDSSKSQKRKGRKRSTSSESDTSNGGKNNSASIFGKDQDMKPQNYVIKDLKIKLEKIDINGKLLVKIHKPKESSDDHKDDTESSSDNSASDLKNIKSKAETQKKSDKSSATFNGGVKSRRNTKRSSSVSTEDEDFDCRRSSRGNKFVIKKREIKQEKAKPKWKKTVRYDEDEDFTVSESPTSDDDSDPDYGAGESKRSKEKSKQRNRKKGSSSSEEEEKHGHSHNESDEEFDRLLRNSSDEGDSDDSTSLKRKRENQKSMKFAKTIVGKDNNKYIDGHQSYCRQCREGGKLVCCLSCNWSYHLICLDPPLDKVPPGSWECPRCTVEPLPGHVNEILSWRWEKKSKRRNKNMSQEQLKLLQSVRPKKEYFVHYAEQSYWKCDWVSEFQMILFHKNRTVHFDKHIDREERYVEEQPLTADSTDPLYDRFYRHGVKPEWLNVHRVINQRENDDGETQYLVKWRGLSYTSLSWEDEDNDEILDFKKYQDIYHEWRQVFTGDAGHNTRQVSREKILNYEFKYISKPPKKPTTDLDDEYESQPSFVDTAAGLKLHDYQLESLNWLRKCWNNDLNTILADEMGLGKTIQAIMFIYSLYKEGHSRGPFLITAPLSTIVNWEREFEIWAPDFYVVTYTGMNDERQIIREHEFSYRQGANGANKVAAKVRGALKFHVLLTSYEFITIDIECLSSIKWAAIIVDEAHRLKNSNSRFFSEMEEYDSEYKLLLTGTPLQNNLNELFNMLRFLCPKKIRKLSALEKEFEDEDVDNDTHEERFIKLKDMLEKHMLRRVKEDVLKDLPLKSEIIVKVELSPMQRKYYKFILTKNFAGLNSQNSGHWATLMMVLSDLQKCCNHPYLFSTAMLEAPVTEDDIYETSALVEASGKLSLLQKMLTKLKETKHRVLIFSHFTRMLDILEDFLAGSGHKFERIDGKITGPTRQASIDRFNSPDSDYFVFLLSTKAGGLGINLATADTVILYDSDWNPHNDIQAFSRAHRIGQTNKVMIYRFITRNSIEERIAQVARNKLMLNHVVLEAGKGDLKFKLSKTALDQIIRHGTEDLFKEGRNVRDNFTDEAVEELLNRSKEDGDHKEDVPDEDSPADIFSSVKVVSYVTKDFDEPDDVAEVDTADDYWEKLLGPLCNRKVEEASSEPLGKRVKKQINYMEVNKELSTSSESDSDSGKEQKGKDTDFEVIDVSDSPSDSSETKKEPKKTRIRYRARAQGVKLGSHWKYFSQKSSTDGESSSNIAICKICQAEISAEIKAMECHRAQCFPERTNIYSQFENLLKGSTTIPGQSQELNDKSDDPRSENSKDDS